MSPYDLSKKEELLIAINNWRMKTRSLFKKRSSDDEIVRRKGRLLRYQ